MRDNKTLNPVRDFWQLAPTDLFSSRGAPNELATLTFPDGSRIVFYSGKPKEDLICKPYTS